MSLTEKYRPKTASELIGNEKAIQKFKEALREGKHCFLYGEPGIGKTSATYALAADFGYNVVEMNASDERRKGELEALLGRVRMKGLRKVLYLLDEVDGIKNWGLIQKILASSIHPIVMTANDMYKVPDKTTALCVKIRFYRPRIDDVVERMKKVAAAEGRKVKYSSVSGDVRASINAVMYGGERYEIENPFDKVSAALHGDGIEGLKAEDLIWLLDNLHRYYKGRDLYEATQMLALAAQTRVSLLNGLPRGRGEGPLYPYFLRRANVLRKGKK